MSKFDSWDENVNTIVETLFDLVAEDVYNKGNISFDDPAIKRVLNGLFDHVLDKKVVFPH